MPIVVRDGVLEYVFGKKSIYSTQWNKIVHFDVPNGVTTIGDAFRGSEALTSITIPDSVTSIEAGAFFDCTSLTSISIPNSVTEIGSSAFENCTSLRSINIPDSVTEIGSSAFENCTSLRSINIPDSVTEIGWRTFWDCKSLKTVTIGKGVTRIDVSAFAGCTNLSSITIPNGVTKIGFSAFAECDNLKTIDVQGNISEKREMIKWLSHDYPNIKILSNGKEISAETRKLTPVEEAERANVHAEVLSNEVKSMAGECIETLTETADVFASVKFSDLTTSNALMGALLDNCEKLYMADSEALKGLIESKNIIPLAIEDKNRNIASQGFLYINKEKGYATLGGVSVKGEYKSKVDAIYAQFEKQIKLLAENMELKLVVCAGALNWDKLGPLFERTPGEMLNAVRENTEQFEKQGLGNRFNSHIIFDDGNTKGV